MVSMAACGLFMLTAERKQLILERLRRDGKVLASELSKEFETSEDTIRRDLRDLAAAGMLQRVHGGALLKPPIAASYAARQKQSPGAKVAIAKAAATLARNGQVIFLDGGTTTLQVVQYLSRDLRATIVTNSAPHAIALAAAEKLETASPFVVAPLKELTYLVTEQTANTRILKQYEKLGITIVRASDR
jgi:DeoR/GlpR family transcriptional regulator of sugar metabolism